MQVRIYGLLATLLSSSLAAAANMNVISFPQGFHPVVSLQGGYASMSVANNTKSFTSIDADIFTYNNSNNSANKGFIGTFLGIEHDLPWFTHPRVFMQTGVEYNYFGSVGVSGINKVGLDPDTSTTYHYRYNAQTQQLLAALKIFVATYKCLNVYGELGLGAAFNHLGQYRATTTETGSVNLTPTFNGQNTSRFSYALGFGVDAQVLPMLRMGIGYRYSNFGRANLGGGAVTYDTYHASVPFVLGRTTAYANQVIAHISFVG